MIVGLNYGFGANHLIINQFITIMKKLISALCLMIGLSASAQQSNHWYFGQHAALDFNSGSPVALNNSQLSTSEGVATLSDQNGNLVMYTNGVNLYDANHTLITNGMHGHKSSSQSSVIVPKPNSTNVYIFTIDDNFASTNHYGLKYTEVSTSGGVSIVTLNNALLPGAVTTEKLVATKHANGIDFWVTTVKESGEFVSYLVSSSGVSGPVSSSQHASYFVSFNDKVGCMKISKNGDKLILARRASNSKNEIFHFDNATGKVIGLIGQYRLGLVYGVEFSEDGNYFYTTEDFERVYQYTVQGFNKTLLKDYQTKKLGALQLAPTGNILVSIGGKNVQGTHLDRISNINSSSPVYTTNAIPLANGTRSDLGLPNFVSDFSVQAKCELELNAKLYGSEENCKKVTFQNLTTSGLSTEIVSYTWTFGDGHSSNEASPTHIYSESGNYEACLEVVGFDGKECCTDRMCFEVRVEDCKPVACSAEPWIHVEETVNTALGACEFAFEGRADGATTDVLAYMWNFGDGTTAIGKNVNHTYLAVGNYTVTLTVLLKGEEGNCCVFKATRVMPISERCITGNYGKSREEETTSIEASSDSRLEDELKKNILVYPNPSKNQLTLDMTIQKRGNYSIKAIDLLGKQFVLSENTELLEGKNGKQLDISSLPSGTYVILVEGENERYVDKFQVIK